MCREIHTENIATSSIINQPVKKRKRDDVSKKAIQKVKGNEKDEENESNIEYIIEKLLEEKVIEGAWKVLVKWKEYIDKLSQSVTDSKKINQK